MKLVELLLEENDTASTLFKKLPPDLLQVLSANAKQNFELVCSGKAPLLFRGTSNKGNWTLNTVHETPRKSKLGDDTFMNAVDTAPKWKKYPSRKRSVFCSTSRKNARLFSKHIKGVYLVIPFDSVNSFGIAPGDFNFLDTTYDKVDLSDLCSVLSNVSKDLLSWQDEEDDYFRLNGASTIDRKIIDFLRKLPKFPSSPISNFRKLLLAASGIDKIVQFCNQSNALEDAADELFGRKFSMLSVTSQKQNNQLAEFLKNNLSPEYSGIKHASSYAMIQQLSGLGQNNIEVWFEGPHVLISTDLVRRK